MQRHPMKNYGFIPLLWLAGTLATQAAPLPPIHVESTIQYVNPENKAWQKINPECRWDKIMLEGLRTETSNRVVVGPKPEGTSDAQTLQLNARMAPNEADKSGPQWLDVKGQLLDASGKSIGDFGFRYDLYEGALNRCKYAKHVGGRFASDIAGWLENPLPGIKISETVASAQPEVMNPADWQSCSADISLPHYLISYLPGQIYRAEEDLSHITSRKLIMKVTSERLLGGGIFTGFRWIELSGSLVDHGQEIGSFVALRRSFRSWTTCGIVDRLNYELAADIAQWLEKPTMNARLGDAETPDEAKR